MGTGDIYNFGTGLRITMCKDACQCRHFVYNNNLTLQIFEINTKSEEIVHFYLIFFGSF